MAYNESAKKATIKYQKEHLSRIILDVKKEKKEEYKAQAAKRGMSLRAYIVSLIEKDMER